MLLCDSARTRSVTVQDVAVLLGVFLCLSHVAVHVDCGIPQRPEAFTSEDELRDYLGNLNNYLSVAGRPR